MIDFDDDDSSSPMRRSRSFSIDEFNGRYEIRDVIDVGGAPVYSGALRVTREELQHLRDLIDNALKG